MRDIFSHNGQKISYVSEWIEGKLWVHTNGKTFILDSGSAAKRNRTGHVGIAHNKVIAPMPGKVTKVLASEGQVVTKGQAVIVMEAMKMEYTLRSDMAGLVEKVRANVGAQVSLGDVLVQLTEEPK